VFGIVAIVKAKWLEDLQEEAGDYSESLFHEHIRASMVSKIDEDNDSVNGVARESAYGVNASGTRTLSNTNDGSEEDIAQLLRSMQNRIDVLERNAGIQSPSPSQAGEEEGKNGPIKEEKGCTVQ